MKPLSLRTKIILAFLTVSLVGAVLTTVFSFQNSRTEFDKFRIQEAENTFIVTAITYYETTGSWTAAGMALRNVENNQGGDSPEDINIPILLVNNDRMVVVPALNFKIGDKIPQDQYEKGTPVLVNGEEVGRVISLIKTPSLNPHEEKYLESLRIATIFSALGAAAVALIMGLILARALSQPLKNLTTAIRAVARGDLKQKVEVKSKDEVGELAEAFNHMSEQLETVNSLRKQMTADVAHDLRTPLTVMSGYLEAMEAGELEPSPERMGILYEEVQHLNRLVEDLRTLSLADAGELSLFRIPVNVNEMLAQVGAAFQQRAAEKNITLNIEVEDNLPALELDPDRMVQVFGNLVMNALRHTPEGGTITLLAHKVEDHVLIQIRDTGQGIPPEALPYLFERFYRADRSRSRQSGESGLGLAIARSIVELHGGAIRAESEGPGKGAIFSIELK